MPFVVPNMDIFELNCTKLELNQQFNWWISGGGPGRKFITKGNSSVSTL